MLRRGTASEPTSEASVVELLAKLSKRQEEQAAEMVKITQVLEKISAAQQVVADGETLMPTGPSAAVSRLFGQ